MVIESLEFYLHVRRLHDLVDLAILLTANELAMFIGQLDLETYLVMERL